MSDVEFSDFTGLAQPASRGTTNTSIKASAINTEKGKAGRTQDRPAEAVLTTAGALEGNIVVTDKGKGILTGQNPLPRCMLTDFSWGV